MKDTVGPMTDDFGNVILEDCVNTRLLNEYFASIFTKANLVDISISNNKLMLCICLQTFEAALFWKKKNACYINASNTVDFAEETVYDKLCRFRATNLVLIEYMHLCYKILKMLFPNHWVTFLAKASYAMLYHIIAS